MEQEVRNVANKLRQLWGNNPDSTLLDEAADALAQKSQLKAETKAPKTSKKGK